MEIKTNTIKFTPQQRLTFISKNGCPGSWAQEIIYIDAELPWNDSLPGWLKSRQYKLKQEVEAAETGFYWPNITGYGSRLISMTAEEVDKRLLPYGAPFCGSRTLQYRICEGVHKINTEYYFKSEPERFPGNFKN